MLTVDEDAAEHMAWMLNEAQAGENIAIRLIYEGGDALLPVMDMVRGSDEKFTFEDQTVLVLDQKMAKFLDGKRLYIHDGDEGPHLAVA